ncbi:hypothetical protein K439DRAFT_1256372, partial [Ramaria rubella]
IADLGNATWTDHHFTGHISKRQYRCPEMIPRVKRGTRADTWSVACLVGRVVRPAEGRGLHPRPASGSWYNRDDNHIAQIIAFVGEF